jgi:anti-sigma B factor antagonist
MRSAPVATAKDSRGEWADPAPADDLTDSPDPTVMPDASGAADEVSVCVGTDLLGLAIQRPANGVCVLAVNGELDVLTAPLLGACLREQVAAAPAHLIVDLQMVRFLGSSGLGCLLDARELIQRVPGMQLHIAGLVTRAVARPLETTGLRDHFDTYPTVAEALTALIG